MPTIADLSARIIEIPLRHRFVTSQDTLARQVSRPVEVCLRLDNGREAFGEAVPVAYVTGETQESVIAAVETARDALIGGDVLRPLPLCRALANALPSSPSARAAIEMAVYNAYAMVSGVSLWSLWGGAIQEVETDVTLSIVEDAPDRAREAAEQGFRRLKMKVGGTDRAAEIARIVAVQRAAPEAVIRLDANQAFTADQTLALIEQVLHAGVKLELVEQPVPKEDYASLDAVAAASPVPIIADEAVKSPADALRLVSETRVQGLNVKVMKAGIVGALDIIAIARAAGRKLMIGCMLESRRGLAASVALACGTGAFDYVDLDSAYLLREEGENPYFTAHGPRLTIKR